MSVCAHPHADAFSLYRLLPDRVLVGAHEFSVTMPALTLRQPLSRSLRNADTVAVRALVVDTMDPTSPNQSQSVPPSKRPQLVRLDSVTPTEVTWLWPGKFALGKISLIAGDPGLGKSFITLDIAARVSRGSDWPDHRANDAGSVILLSAEDDLADTIAPRLIAAGADLTRIAALQSVAVASRERSINLADDLDAIELAIKENEDTRLVIIDPITAYVGATDSHKSAEVRGLLAPLASLAEKYRIAVICVTHLNKSRDMSALYRATGSLAFVAAARAMWLVDRDTGDPSRRRRVLVPVKNNLADDTTGLAYSIVTSENNRCPHVEWDDDPIDFTMEQSTPPSQLQYACEWLKEYLEPKGAVPVTEVTTAAEAAGISGPTLRRARTAVRVIKRKDGNGCWSILLPPKS